MGLLTYVIAGHNPPNRIRYGSDIQCLNRTGTPLGIFDEAFWEQAQAKFNPGDTLVIYTDDVIDSQNSLKNHSNKSAVDFLDGI